MTTFFEQRAYTVAVCRNRTAKNPIIAHETRYTSDVLVWVNCIKRYNALRNERKQWQPGELLKTDYAQVESATFAYMARPTVTAMHETIEQFYERGGVPKNTLPSAIHNQLKELALAVVLANGMQKSFKVQCETVYKELRQAYLYTQGQLTQRALWKASHMQQAPRYVLKSKQKAQGLRFDEKTRLFALGHREQAKSVKTNAKQLSKREQAFAHYESKRTAEHDAYTVLAKAQAKALACKFGSGEHTKAKFTVLQAQVAYDKACANKQSALQAWRELCYAKVNATQSYTVNGVTYTTKASAYIAKDRLRKQNERAHTGALALVQKHNISLELISLKTALARMVYTNTIELTNEQVTYWLPLRDAILHLIQVHEQRFTIKQAYKHGNFADRLPKSYVSKADSTTANAIAGTICKPTIQGTQSLVHNGTIVYACTGTLCKSVQASERKSFALPTQAMLKCSYSAPTAKPSASALLSQWLLHKSFDWYLQASCFTYPFTVEYQSI